MSMKKVTVKVFSPDGKMSKRRSYHPAQLASALRETAENLEKWFKGKRYEQVAVAGGYNFVCRGSR